MYKERGETLTDHRCSGFHKPMHYYHICLLYRGPRGTQLHWPPTHPCITVTHTCIIYYHHCLCIAYLGGTLSIHCCSDSQNTDALISHLLVVQRIWWITVGPKLLRLPNTPMYYCYTYTYCIQSPLFVYRRPGRTLSGHSCSGSQHTHVLLPHPREERGQR